AQPGPARLACTVNSTRPGIHVISESRIARTEDFPSMYSARENGRQKYKGNAPLARSGEMRPGPVNAVSTNASTHCTLTKTRKNLLSIVISEPAPPILCSKLRLLAT